MSGRLVSVGVGIVLALAGCAAVGPNYDGPPDVAKASLGAGSFQRAADAPVAPVPPPARWWEAVGDPVLTQLIDDAFAASPTLASAVAQVRSARAQQAQNRAALGPTGGASARYVRSRIPTGSLTSGAAAAGGGGGSTSSIPDPIQLESWSVSTDATWEIDLFGGRRRAIESAGAVLEARQAALEDVQVTLASDMGQGYAQLREAQNRVALGHRTVRLREDELALTRQRRQRGTAADGDIDAAESALAEARADLPALQTTVVQQLDQIAILAGRAPGAYDAFLVVSEDRPVALPSPPDSVPVGDPADWLRRRPDIRQAERLLAARNATIGVDVAALFPSVSVIGFLSTTGSHLGDLFRSAPLWLATPSLTWNFLSIPTNRARVRGAEADRDASLADYQRTVLAALQDANDSLFRFGRQRQALAQRELARDAAAHAARLTRERYAAGTVSLIDALDSERQRVQAEDARVQAQAGLMRAYVSVNKSLGLGWGAAPPEDGATARASDGLVAAAPSSPPAAAGNASMAPRDATAAAPDRGAAATAAAATGSIDAPVIDAGEGLSNAPGRNPASRTSGPGSFPAGTSVRGQGGPALNGVDGSVARRPTRGGSGGAQSGAGSAGSGSSGASMGTVGPSGSGSSSGSVGASTGSGSGRRSGSPGSSSGNAGSGSGGVGAGTNGGGSGSGSTGSGSGSSGSGAGAGSTGSGSGSGSTGSGSSGTGSGSGSGSGSGGSR